MTAQHGGGRVWLDVPFADKDQAKQLGARWDPTARRWYAGPRAHRDLHARWAPLPELPTTLPGEDLSFGSGLYVDLIPDTCWFTNVRSCVHQRDWERLRRMLIERAGGRCELCGRGEDRETRRRLEAHERFDYDEATGTQTLRRLVLVCSDCHEVTHYGLAQVRGRDREAFAHLRAVTGMTEAQAEAHIAQAFAIWDGRSARVWKLDLSPLTAAGMTVTPPPDAVARAQAAAEQVQRRRANEAPTRTGPAALRSGGHDGCGCDGDPEPGVTVRTVTWDEVATSDSPIGAILRGGFHSPTGDSTPPPPIEGTEPRARRRWWRCS